MNSGITEIHVHVPSFQFHFALVEIYLNQILSQYCSIPFFFFSQMVLMCTKVSLRIILRRYCTYSKWSQKLLLYLVNATLLLYPPCNPNTALFLWFSFFIVDFYSPGACVWMWCNDWLMDWLTEWMNEWMNEWLVDWLSESGWLADCWLNAWLTEWPTEWLKEWLSN